LRLLQNSIWGQICAFNVGFEFFANRLWPIGYVNLRKIEATSKSSNLALKASFARASIIFYIPRAFLEPVQNLLILHIRTRIGSIRKF
jgi:hypothetical protein